MSNENKNGKREDKELRASFRKSYDTIPPQTGRFRNLFEEMKNRQNGIEAGSQARSGDIKDSSRRDNSDE